MSSPLNLRRTIEGRHYYCPHFTDKENEASEDKFFHKDWYMVSSWVKPVLCNACILKYSGIQLWDPFKQLINVDLISSWEHEIVFGEESL